MDVDSNEIIIFSSFWTLYLRCPMGIKRLMILQLYSRKGELNLDFFILKFILYIYPMYPKYGFYSIL